ncbi:MAG: rhodanese-like domain-containing protein [Bacteroidales bacterium]|nr:rhodanese-like domain-containing protein [Bacteroidales bacterium]
MKTRLLLLLSLMILVTFTQSCKDGYSEDSLSDQVSQTLEQLITETKTRIQEMKPEQVMTLIDNMDPFVLIDVREQNEYDKGYIPGSFLIPRGVLEFRIANEKVWENEGMYMPAKDELIIICCKKGSRGAFASESLQNLGYTNVKNLEGGFLNWKKNYPEQIEKVEQLNISHGAAAKEESGGGC